MSGEKLEMSGEAQNNFAYSGYDGFTWRRAFEIFSLDMGLIKFSSGPLPDHYWLSLNIINIFYTYLFAAHVSCDMRMAHVGGVLVLLSTGGGEVGERILVPRPRGETSIQEDTCEFLPTPPHNEHNLKRRNIFIVDL